MARVLILKRPYFYKGHFFKKGANRVPDAIPENFPIPSDAVLEGSGEVVEVKPVTKPVALSELAKVDGGAATMEPLALKAAAERTKK